MHVDDSEGPHRDDPPAVSDRTSYGRDFAGRHATAVQKVSMPINLFVVSLRFSARYAAFRSIAQLDRRCCNNNAQA